MAGSDRHSRAIAAIERGRQALLARQNDGYWTGFPTLAGRSSVWVTAFVTAHLPGDGVSGDALHATRRWLAAQRFPGAGWGYGDAVPADADSTAWSLIALHGTGILDDRALAESAAFLASHQTEDGTATYLDDGRIRRYIDAPVSHSIEGWTSPHDDVTAAALLANVPPVGSEAANHALARLLSRQTGAGVWEAYWWRGPWYTTALILRALDHSRRALTLDMAGKIERALAREVLADGGYGLGATTECDAFTTALALECHCRLKGPGVFQAREAMVAALLGLQEPDGCWPGTYSLRIPAPDVVDPRHVSGWSTHGGGGNSFVRDEGGLFATALACFALHMMVTAKPSARHLPIFDDPIDQGQAEGDDVATVVRA